MKRKLLSAAEIPPSKKASKVKAKSEATLALLSDCLRGDPDKALEVLRDLAADAGSGGKLGGLFQRFLREGGTAGDLLSLMSACEKVKTSDVVVVFKACEAILLRLASPFEEPSAEEEQLKDRFNKLSVDITREVLTNHIKYVTMLLSPSNTAQQVVSVLKLLTAMVTCCPAAAKEVLLKLDLDHPSFGSVVGRQSSLIRRSFLQFLLSFLITSPSVAKEFLEKKSGGNGLLASFFPGLVHDDCQTVLLSLVTLREKVVENGTISKTNKMKLFGVNNLRSLLGLHHWKGSKKTTSKDNDDDCSDEESRGEDLESVREAMVDFFHSILANTKSGVVFWDPSLGASGTNQNHLLQNLLQIVQRPWESPHLSAVVVGALGACPDQIRPYFTKVLSPLWAPRPGSPDWFCLADMVDAIFHKLDVASVLAKIKGERALKASKATLLKLVLQDRLLQEMVVPAVQHENLEVGRKGLRLLATLLDKVDAVAVGGFENDGPLAARIGQTLEEKLPKVWTLVDCLKRELAPLHLATDYDSVLTASKSLRFYHDWLRKTSSSLLTWSDTCDLLAKVNQLAPEVEAAYERTVIHAQLNLLKIMSSMTGQVGSGSQYTLENFLLLTNLAASRAWDDARSLAFNTLRNILGKAGLYDSDQRGIDLELWFLLASPDQLPRLASALHDGVFNRRAQLLREESALRSSILEADEPLETGKKGPDRDSLLLLDELLAEDLLVQEGSPPNEEDKEGRLRVQPIVLGLIQSFSTNVADDHGYLTSCLMALLSLQDHPDRLASILLKLGSSSKSGLRIPRPCRGVLETLASGKTDAIGLASGGGCSLADPVLELHRLFFAFRFAGLSEDAKTETKDRLLQLAAELGPKAAFGLLSMGGRVQDLLDPFGGGNTEASELVVGLLQQMANRLDFNPLRKSYFNVLLEKTNKYLRSTVRKESTGCYVLTKALDTLVSHDRNKVRQLFRSIVGSIGESNKLLSRCSTPMASTLICWTLKSMAEEMASASSPGQGSRFWRFKSDEKAFVANLCEAILSKTGSEGIAAEGTFPTSVLEPLLESINLILPAVFAASEAPGGEPGSTASGILLKLAMDSNLGSSSGTLKALVASHASSGTMLKKVLRIIRDRLKGHEDLGKLGPALAECLRLVGPAKEIGDCSETVLPISETILRLVNDSLSRDGDRSSQEGLLEVSKAISQHQVNLPALQRVITSWCDGGPEVKYGLPEVLLMAHWVRFASQRPPGKTHEELRAAGIRAAKRLVMVAMRLEDAGSMIEAAPHIANLVEEEASGVGELLLPLGDGAGDWRRFCRMILKVCLKANVPSSVGAIRSLTSLCKRLLQPPGQEVLKAEEARLLLRMVCSHSNFMVVLFSLAEDLQPLKLAVLRLVLALMAIVGSGNVGDGDMDDVEGGRLIGLFLGAYRATLSPCDRIILKVLKTLESANPARFKMFSPVFWGHAAVTRYSATAITTFPRVVKPSQVLGLIEPERMIRSAVHFPIRLRLEDVFDEGVAMAPWEPSSSACYDPRFFLLLACNLCVPQGPILDRHLMLIESGLLSLALASLSSLDPSLRSLGLTALCRMYEQLKMAKKALAAEKQVWVHFIELVRNGLASSATPEVNKEDDEVKRIPSITATFLARAAVVISNPLDPLYRSISSFVLAKPALDLFDIPDFLRLFHSCDPPLSSQASVEDQGGGSASVHHPGGNGGDPGLRYLSERHWILKVVRDGTKDKLDLSVIRQNYLLKILMSFHSCSLADEASRHLILSILEKVASISAAASYELVKKHGLLPWILANISSEHHSGDSPILHEGETRDTAEVAAKQGGALASILIAAFKSIACPSKVKSRDPKATGREEASVPSTGVLKEFLLCSVASLTRLFGRGTTVETRKVRLPMAEPLLRILSETLALAAASLVAFVNRKTLTELEGQLAMEEGYGGSEEVISRLEHLFDSCWAVIEKDSSSKKSTVSPESLRYDL